MRAFGILSLGLLVSWSCSVLLAQPPQVSKEHELLKKDVGTWNAQVKVWAGPDGQADPSAEPVTMEGKEKNRMLGELWLISDFEGEFGGMPFSGHGVTGYNPQLKKYVGSWVDSMTPIPMHMEGTYDEQSKTMTTFNTGVGPDGQEAKGKSEIVYEDDDHRVMTMYALKPGTEDEYVKMMEIRYERAR